VQRRSDYRVRATSDSGLVARVWRIGEQADLKDMPMSCMELPVELRDLSIGGMGMFVTKPEAGVPPLAHDARLRVELIHAGQSLILDGRLRHAPTNGADAGPKIRVGVQFKELENDLNGRQTLTTLTRIVGHLQREEVRRARLGLAEAS
jgi:c-di-GMP-binding flagellar brake protein YcgR